MHIPGQEFGHVRMETDRESDLLTCKSKTSKEDLKKEQLKIEMENLPFPRDIVLFTLPLCGAHFKPIPLRLIGCDGPKQLVHPLARLVKKAWE